ncbi:peptidylprolyl isomerase [Cardiobacterium sp. AH-315-I02]|nr:peptidylprolyl isomerase [Cardiobacterium sp. AH-315-I02]
MLLLKAEIITLSIKYRSVVAGLCLSLSGLAIATDSVTTQQLITQKAAITNAAKHVGSSARLFAKVGDEVITFDQYQQSFQRALRIKFYHAKPPETGLSKVYKTVADELIMRQLLLQEAQRRQLIADETAINKILAQYDQRYAGSTRWLRQRNVLLKNLRKKLSDDDVLQQLENQVRNVVPPTVKQLKQFYLDNPGKFTEPTQQKLSLVLLKVDPSSSSDVWAAALKKGQKLVRQLRNGADFAELARLHSSDVSARQGGDMGYVHREMLAEEAQKVVDKLKPGELSDAFRVLQGIAVLRLDGRKTAQLRDFNDVADRARRLWMRDKSESAWAFLQEKLHLDTPVTVFNDMHNNMNNSRQNDTHKKQNNKNQSNDV